MAPNTAQAPSGRDRRCALFAKVWLMFAMYLLGAPANAGELAPLREFQVKAVFLYNFAQFVEWPSSAFEGPEGPLVIGILGLDPFGEVLDELVKGETVNGRLLMVKRYRRVEDIDRCHILFVSGSEGPRIDQIVAELNGRSVLTVCDWEGFGGRGAMVRFVMERNRVRLRINLEAAKAAGLNISSKLLRSAETVIQ